jgi:hypothetical protein
MVAEQSGQVAHKLQRVTAEYAVDFGSCLHWGKPILLFRDQQLTYSSSFTCEIMQLISVVVCVVRAVHKIEFGLFIEVTRNKRRQV